MLHIEYTIDGPAFQDHVVDGVAAALVNGLLRPGDLRQPFRTSTGVLIDAIVDQVITQRMDPALVDLRIGDQVYELNRNFLWTKAGEPHTFENMLHREWPTLVDYGERQIVYALNNNRRIARETENASANA